MPLSLRVRKWPSSPPAVITAASLQSGLVGYWRLNEASGNRADTSGNSRTLTDNNTVLAGTGKVGANAADFERTNSEYLSRADEAGLEAGSSSWSACGWFNWESIDTGHTLLSKFDWTGGGGAGRGYWGGITGASPYNLHVKCIDAGGNTITFSHSTGLSTATWYFASFGFDATQLKAWFRLNNGAREYSSAAGGMSLPNGTYAFMLGFTANGGANNYFDGLMEQWGLWIGRVLTDAELNYLYNGDAGRILF